METGKLFVGPRLRRLREQHRLSQAACAERLGLSHSYLNQLENNQRPVSAAVLIKYLRSFNVDVAQFADDGAEQSAADIHFALRDPALADCDASRADIQQFSHQQPELALAFSHLYRHFTRLREEHEQLIGRFYGEQHAPHLSPLPHEEVRDFFYQHNNYFDALDHAAEQLAQRLSPQPEERQRALADYLQRELGVTVHTPEVPVGGGLVRHYDRAMRRLALPRQRRNATQGFQLATQIALLEQEDLIDELCRDAGFTAEGTRQLARQGLAHYFAGAVLMPYGEFLAAAEAARYDVEILQARFAVSTEQACHRLSTLQRPRHKGVPFYFVRVDQAGNISKRQSAGSFHFARTGGACPLWNVHEAFAFPGQVITQVAEMPDGQRYFCTARQVSHGGGSYRSPLRRFAIGLGCELEQAHRLVYADGLDLGSASLVTRIGPGCRVCPRQDCPQRAFPQAGLPLSVDSDRQSLYPYSA